MFNNLVIFSLAINGLLLIWIISLSLMLRKYRYSYKSASKALKQGNLPELVEKSSRGIDTLNKKVEDIYSLNGKLNKKIEDSYRNIGLVRFNAFSESGGDLSYSLALLDDNSNGLVITSLVGRKESRTFVKEIKEGKGTPDLSDEEEQSIIKAINERR